MLCRCGIYLCECLTEKILEMKISHRWLQEFVALPAAEWNPERVATVLTDLGLEVEDVVDMSKVLRGFVVGHVLDKQPHPKADKLSVCTVDIGQEAPKTIVCGAKNVAAGQRVPVAAVGAVVPSAGFAIEERPLRGVTSQGMICSQAELGLGEDHDGIWVLAADAPVGAPLAVALGIDDVIYDVAITPNRADCLSHLGIARDLAAFMRSAVCRPTVDDSADALPATSTVRVEISDAALCRRFMVRSINNVTIGESPIWLKDRLTAVGLRPRNVVVDVTNYVMLECGQPLHAYDANQVAGKLFRIQTAEQAGVTQFTTLDGRLRELAPAALLICDAEQPIGIAGIMGGENSEITNATTSVLLESAWFTPSSVRRTAKVLGLSTDASYRFERGVDIAGVEWALDRATQLLCELTGGVAVDRVDAYPAPLTPASFVVRFDRMRSIVGVDVTDEWIVEVCRAIGCQLHAVDATSVTVTAPTWRMDITGEIDIAEEVMRLYGIDNVPSAERAHISIDASKLPGQLRAGGPHGHAQRMRVRTILATRGYADCVSNVLGSPEDHYDAASTTVALKNALGREFSSMRSSLVPSLLRIASRNMRHGASVVRLMEIGSVFAHENASEFGLRQHELLTMVASGSIPAQWTGKGRALDLYDIVGDVMALSAGITTRTVTTAVPFFTNNVLECLCDGVVVGHVGQIDPRVATACGVESEVAAAVLNLRLFPVVQRRYSPVSAFPTVERDLAFVVPEDLRSGDLVAMALVEGAPFIRDAEVFDVYRDAALGSARKSLAIRMTFGAMERTLVDADVDSAIAAVTAAATSKFGAALRGTEAPLAAATSDVTSHEGA